MRPQHHAGQLRSFRKVGHSALHLRLAKVRSYWCRRGRRPHNVAHERAGTTPTRYGRGSPTRDGRAIYDRDVPSDLVLKVMNGVHRLVLGASRGRLGWSASGMPVIELTTIGRRSGQARTTLLTSPYREGSTLVVVASRGGDDRDPAWLLNLRDQPQVTVSVGGKPPQAMRAEVAGPDERARLWPLVTADHRIYANYQRKTKREIPLVLLRPIEG